MGDRPKIPIKNIYYMLCYAWEILPRDKDNLVGKEEFDNIYNLLTKLILRDIISIIKRGFHREYILNEEDSTIIRGKIVVGESIKRGTILRKTLICQYDEFSENVTFNQILKTTMNLLMKSPYLDYSLKKDLTKVSYHFGRIEEISLNRHVFGNLKYNRNNMHYKMLMNICELIYLGLISNEEDQQIQFADFIRDKQMATLYEKFVLNFYKKHLPSSRYKTHSPKIAWGLNDTFNHVGLEYLPQMKSDIVIENREEGRQLIIDTKYYAENLKKNNHGDVKKLISSNLYQIFTYINNSSFGGEVNGMLLYPTSEEDLDLEFKINDKIILIKTLNLASDWESIYKRLITIGVI